MKVFYDDGIVKHIFGESLSNRKTGYVSISTHLNSAVHPVQSRKDKLDSKTCCKGCSLADGNGCYVMPQMLSSMWKGVQGEKPLSLQDFVKKAKHIAAVSEVVRFGNFGNPTTLGAEILLEIKSQASASLGYCADWNLSSEYKTILFASTKTAEDTESALALGWKVYQISKDIQLDREKLKKLGVRAVHCPYQATKTITCRQCRLCDASTSSVDVVLSSPHGSSKNKVFSV